MTGREFKLPSADLHARAEEYFSQLDRDYFEAHPTASGYTRPPVDHEWCCPACYEDDGRCVPMVGIVTAVDVMNVASGVRARQPLVLTSSIGCGHAAELGVLPTEWVERIRRGSEEPGE